MWKHTKRNKIPFKTTFHPFLNSWNLSPFSQPAFTANSQMPLNTATTMATIVTKAMKKINPVRKIFVASIRARKPTLLMPLTTMTLVVSATPELLLLLLSICA